MRMCWSGILVLGIVCLGGCAVGTTFDDEAMVGLRVGEKTVANAARRIASAGMDIAGTLGLVGGGGAGLGLLAWIANRSGAKQANASRDLADAHFDEGVARGAGVPAAPVVPVSPGTLPVGSGAAGAAGGGGAAQAAGVTA